MINKTLLHKFDKFCFFNLCVKFIKKLLKFPFLEKKGGNIR